MVKTVFFFRFRFQGAKVTHALLILTCIPFQSIILLKHIDLLKCQLYVISPECIYVNWHIMVYMTCLEVCELLNHSVSVCCTGHLRSARSATFSCFHSNGYVNIIMYHNQFFIDLSSLGSLYTMQWQMKHLICSLQGSLNISRPSFIK